MTPRQREILRSVFARFADRIESVAVYGSRVQGRARPGSDIDLVVFGSDVRSIIGAITGDLEESELSVFADVVSYDDIRHAPLREQIDRWKQELFGRAELTAARETPSQAA